MFLSSWKSLPPKSVLDPSFNPHFHPFAPSLTGAVFLSSWKSLPPESQQRLEVVVSSMDAAKAKLQANSLFVLAHRPVMGIGSPVVVMPVHTLRWLEYSLDLGMHTCKWVTVASSIFSRATLTYRLPTTVPEVDWYATGRHQVGMRDQSLEERLQAWDQCLFCCAQNRALPLSKITSVLLLCELLISYLLCSLPLQVPGTKQEALYVTGRVGGPSGGQVLLELRITPGQQVGLYLRF